MKKRMLASILASSLAVMSLSFFGLSAYADREMVTDVNEIVMRPNETHYELISTDPSDRSYDLCCNHETKTAFKVLRKELPPVLRWFLSDVDRFKDGMIYGFSTNVWELKFPNADITTVDDFMHIVNHGAIIYVDDNGEEHTFSNATDVEDYIIQNYNVTFVDYESVKEVFKVEYPEPTHTWVDLVTRIETCEDNYHHISLYHNGDTKTAFKYCTADLPNILKFLIDASDTFDDGMEFGLSTTINLKFPDAEISVNGNRMGVTNHGPIVYVDDNGEEHSFSGFPDLENYIIQNYNVTVVDYDKYMEDGSIVPVDTATTPVNNTTAPSYFTGDVTGDGAVDLTDAISLNKIFAGMITPTNVQTTAADINQDGSVTDDDLSILMQFLIGVRTDLTDAD